MLTFLAYLAEIVIGSIPDIAIAGLGAYLLGRGGKAGGWGIFILTLYIIAVVGMFMGPTRDPGPIFGGLSACVFGLLGYAARARRMMREAESRNPYSASSGGADRSPSA